MIWSLTWSIKHKQNEKFCIKGVNLNFASHNTFYVISVHPLEKYHIQWHGPPSWGRTGGQRGREAGIFQGLAFLTDSFLFQGPHRKLPCHARPTWRLLGALGDLSLFLTTLASFCPLSVLFCACVQCCDNGRDVQEEYLSKWKAAALMYRHST